MEIKKISFPVNEMLLFAMLTIALCLTTIIFSISYTYSKQAKELNDAVQISRSISQLYLGSNDIESFLSWCNLENEVVIYNDKDCLKFSYGEYFVQMLFKRIELEETTIMIFNKDETLVYQLVIEKAKVNYE